MLSFIKSCLMFLMLGTITVSTLPISIVNDVQKGELISNFYRFLLMAFIPWVIKATVYYVLPFMSVIGLLLFFAAAVFPIFGERVPLRKAFSMAWKAIRDLFESKIMPLPTSSVRQAGKKLPLLNKEEI